MTRDRTARARRTILGSITACTLAAAGIGTIILSWASIAPYLQAIADRLVQVSNAPSPHARGATGREDRRRLGQAATPATLTRLFLITEPRR